VNDAHVIGNVNTASEVIESVSDGAVNSTGWPKKVSHYIPNS